MIRHVVEPIWKDLSEQGSKHILEKVSTTVGSKEARAATARAAASVFEQGVRAARSNPWMSALAAISAASFGFALSRVLRVPK